ncbi:MAG: hypothetical protein QF898_03435, partial [SAR202 cluster bacterium]|nr:hypothetical protein [SAR202 cluster bacterium]
READPLPNTPLLPSEEREQIEELIKSFDDHGCGFGLDIQAQIVLRRLLDIIDTVEQQPRK